jgi:hypothetical protein
MLQQIDTAIAFAVVMLMLSLIVMAIVQMVSALTDLRGRNLASGLQNLLRQIEPDFRELLPQGRRLQSTLPRLSFDIRRSPIDAVAKQETQELARRACAERYEQRS